MDLNRKRPDFKAQSNVQQGLQATEVDFWYKESLQKRMQKHAKQSLVGTVCWPNQSMLVQAKVQELAISSRSVHL